SHFGGHRSVIWSPSRTSPQSTSIRWRTGNQLGLTTPVESYSLLNELPGNPIVVSVGAMRGPGHRIVYVRAPRVLPVPQSESPGPLTTSPNWVAQKLPRSSERDA